MPEPTETPSEIISKYLKEGFVKARELTKAETHKKSQEMKDLAWSAGNRMIQNLIQKFYDGPSKKYTLGTPHNRYFLGLLFESLKSFQNTFRLAEEGYYRSSFADLRDLLELVMRIAYFYYNEEDFDKWIKGHFYTTRNITDTGFFGDVLTEKIEKFSNALSANRHATIYTLDSFGPIMTNASYYRRELFEKWCIHMLKLDELSLEIIVSGEILRSKSS